MTMTRFITYVSEAAYRHASLRNILMLAGAILFFVLIIFPFYQKQIVPEGGPPILDLQFSFSREEGWETLNRFGEAGRQAYFQMLLLADTIFPLIYGLFFILLTSRVLRKHIPQGSFWRILNLGAIDVVVFDLCENIFIMYMLAKFPQEAATATRMASICGALKWVVLSLVMAMILVGFLSGLMRRTKQ